MQLSNTIEHLKLGSIIARTKSGDADSPIWGKRTVGNETTWSCPFLIESKFFYMVVGDAVQVTDGWPADVATMPYMVFV